MSESKTYVLTVIGENILISGELRKALGGRLDDVLCLGFEATRVVTAKDEASAKERAIADAFEALRKALPLPLANEPADPPTFRVDDVSELEPDENYTGPRSGFAFFPDRKLPADDASSSGWRKAMKSLRGLFSR